MTVQWTRCATWVATGITATLLAACGSSTVDSAISPQRVVAFGDGNADLGQVSGRTYTVTAPDIYANWTSQIALGYGKTLTSVSAGGLSYAQGNARVTTSPDAAGNASTPTVQQQITNFLASNQFDGDDLVLVSAGLSDVVVQAQAVLTNGLSRDTALANARTAGVELARQVNRMINAGAKYVAVAGAYTIGKGPWGVALNNAGVSDAEGFLNQLSSKFNEGFKVEGVNLGLTGDKVLYVDFEEYVNYIYNTPAAFSVGNTNTTVCNSVDTGNGIGTGTNQINSALCSKDTVIDSNYDQYLFADRVYLTPNVHRQFGNWAYDQIRSRW